MYTQYLFHFHELQNYPIYKNSTWIRMAKITRGMFSLGFPADVNIEMLETVYNRTKHLDVNHMTYTSAMLSTESEVSC